MNLISQSFLAIFFLFLLVFSQQKSAEIKSIFEKEMALNEDFKSSVYSKNSRGISGKTYDTLRMEKEDFHRSIFSPALVTAIKLICDKKDGELLRTYFKVVVSDTNSADEALPTSLGEMFLCQTNLFISEYNNARKTDKPIILRTLCTYCDSIPYQKDNGNPDFTSIKSKLLNNKEQYDSH